MVKGRTSRVLSIRLPDQVYESFSKVAAARGLAIGVLLRWQVDSLIHDYYLDQLQSQNRARAAAEEALKRALRECEGLHELWADCVELPPPAEFLKSEGVANLSQDEQIEEYRAVVRAHLDGLAEPEVCHEMAIGGGKYPGTSRNAPCPCGSGKKYKRCCGA